MATTLSAKPPYSVLYEQRRWMWHEWYSMHIEFGANGRGALWWLVEHDWIIVVTLDWEVTASAAGGEETSDETQARPIGTFDLTMKLHRHPALGASNQDWYSYLDRHYTPSAYEPKHFKITIEQGIFRSAMRAGSELEDLRRANWSRDLVPEKDNISERWRYSYRLVFDKSPYPLKEDWACPVHPRMRSTNPETKVEFLAQRLPESEYGKPAMNQAWQREMVRAWEAQYTQPPNEADLELQRRNDKRRPVLRSIMQKQGDRKQTEREMKYSKQESVGEEVRKTVEEKAFVCNLANFQLRLQERRGGKEMFEEKAVEEKAVEEKAVEEKAVEDEVGNPSSS